MNVSAETRNSSFHVNTEKTGPGRRPDGRRPIEWKSAEREPRGPETCVVVRCGVVKSHVAQHAQAISVTSEWNDRGV